jgi:hypothetical protein
MVAMTNFTQPQIAVGIAPPTGMCKLCHGFRQAFTDALRKLVELQNEQIQAVVRHDPEFARFDILVHMAMQKKHETKYALLKHLEAHEPRQESQHA